jgi:lysophospholipase L1-like esterase
VKNGAMTQGLDVPQDWRGKDGAVEVKRDTEVFKVGPSSLRVSVAGGKSGNAHQRFEGGAKGRFKLAGWMKTQGNIKAQVAVHAFAEGYKNNKWIQAQYLQGDQDWMRFEKEIQLPEWTSFFNVMLSVEGDGKAWIDEVHEAASPVDQGREQSLREIMTTQAPAKDKPFVPAWGFYPQFPGGWMSFHEGNLARTRQGRGKNDINVIFYGDSITQGWDDGNGGKDIWGKRYAPLGAVNYGRGGDSTRQVLWRIQNGEVEGLNPKLIVLKIGTNNLYEDFNAGSDADIAKGIETIVKTLREKLPNTKILLLGVLPRQNTWFSGRAKNINAIIKNLDDGKTVRFLDMSDKFQTEPGKVVPELYSKDQLHLAKPGYELWATTMQPLFDEMLK